MRPNHVRERLAAGQPVVNAWLSSDGRYAAECLSYSGYDAVTVDLQHGMFGLDAAVALLQAVSAGPAIPMARCSSNSAAEIGKLLDAGAYGIICPSVEDGEQCAAFVAACRYPPQGRRSFGPSRGLLYGGPDYVGAADETVLTWAMVESAAALDHLEEIVTTPGLDGIYVGPNDLAMSVGEEPGASFGPIVLPALRRVADTAHTHGRWVGVFCGAGAPQAVDLLDLGYDLVTPGNDISLLRDAAAIRVAAVHGWSQRSGTLNDRGPSDAPPATAGSRSEGAFR